jgi:hypothetical protein
MEDNVYVLPSEKIETAVPTATPTATIPVNKPTSIEDIIAGLRGFGVEENEEILTFTSRTGRNVRLRITNMPTDEELNALVSAEEFKGYAWVQRIRVEILSRSISWIDGVDIRSLREQKAAITDVDGVKRDVQIVLRNVILGWGQELVQTLWKIAMVHSDKIEKRYQAEFPDSTIMTEVERRFMETVMREIEDTSKEIIEDSVKQMFEKEE